MDKYFEEKYIFSPAQNWDGHPGCDAHAAVLVENVGKYSLTWHVLPIIADFF